VTEPTGHCFPWAWRFAFDLGRERDEHGLSDDDIRVVHAVVNAGYPRRRFEHAWVEAGESVYDGDGQPLDRADYYRAMEPENVRKFSRYEALVNLPRSGHYGPWPHEGKLEVVRENPQDLYHLFCYGSNSPQQLAERLGHPVQAFAAWAEGWQRQFSGWSRGWGGSVATLVKKRGATTYGALALVNWNDIEGALDRYEGYPSVYDRQLIKVHCPDVKERGTVDAIAYLHVGIPAQGPPSRDYLDAVAQTISTFWSGDDGSPVTADDIPIRLKTR
jgi:hypothetical protein